MVRHGEQGFSILEVLIAAALVAGTVVTLVALVYRAEEQSLHTASTCVAATLAQAKLEELQTAPFSFTAAGIPVDAPELAPSQDDAHLVDAAGYVDAAGRFGEPVAMAASPAFVRRWSVSTIAGNVDTRRLAVCVTTLGTRSSAVRPACVWTIRTRQP